MDAAVPDIFRGARVVLTPDRTAPEPRRSCPCWKPRRARDGEAGRGHDRIFASVSHLPHILAFALVSEIVSRPDSAELLGFAAGGFRDFTRIAASSPEMWRDIALANREALLEELDRFAARAAVFRELVAKGDGPGLQRLMTEARNARRSWVGGKRSTSDE